RHRAKTPWQSPGRGAEIVTGGVDAGERRCEGPTVAQPLGGLAATTHDWSEGGMTTLPETEEHLGTLRDAFLRLGAAFTERGCAPLAFEHGAIIVDTSACIVYATRGMDEIIGGPDGLLGQPLAALLARLELVDGANGTGTGDGGGERYRI